MSCMCVSNFEAIGHVTLVLGPENRHGRFGVKSRLSHGYMS